MGKHSRIEEEQASKDSVKNKIKQFFINAENFHDILVFVFFSVSTWFIFSVIRASILVPILLRESSLARFQPDEKIEINPNHFSDQVDRQMSLLFDELGFYNFSMLSVPLFLILGLTLHSFAILNIRIDFKVIWSKILSTSLSISALLITVFSLWEI